LNELEQKRLDKKLSEIRTERYLCQSVARQALPQERVSKCLRVIANNTRAEVWKHLKTQKAFFNGLIVCGSVWHCPICAAKISERRKLELKQAHDLHLAEGGKIALLTLTFSHKKTDKLKDTIQKFGQATQKLFRGKRYDNIRSKMGLIGRVRGFEVTYGNNGFHPHTHTLLFYKNDVDLEYIKSEMYDLWEKACQKFGLTVKERYGLDLQDGHKAEEYLSKHGTWSLEQELSKSHIKKGKLGSLTPFDFLRVYLETEEEKYLKLFKEYADCFKGKRQIQWSQGLKKRFIIEEKTDESLAKEKMEDADLLGFIELEEWKLIVKYGMRSKILDYCEKYGFEQAISKMKNEIQTFENAMKNKKDSNLDKIAPDQNL
jgi:Replication protein